MESILSDRLRAFLFSRADAIAHDMIATGRKMTGEEHHLINFWARLIARSDLDKKKLNAICECCLEPGRLCECLGPSIDNHEKGEL